MSDSTQTDLQVPSIDWANYDTGNKVSAPPQAKDAKGQYIVYYAQLPTEFPEDAFGQTQQGFLKVKIDPLTLVNNGQGIDGHKLRFQSLSAKQYTTRDGKTLNASQLGNFLMAAKTGAQPSDVDGYKAAVRQTAGATIPITLEWELYDKQAGAQVKDRYDDFEGPTGSKSPVFTTPDGRTLVARAKVKNYITRA